MANLSKDRLIFDPTDATDSDNVGAYLRDSAGALITSTSFGGIQALDVNVVGASGILHQEDEPHNSGDYGNFMLAVRNDSLASLTDTDLDYSPIAVDEFGRLKTTSTVTVPYSYAEDNAHTSGDIGAFILAVRHDADTSLTDADGDYAPLQVNANGRLKVEADITTTNNFEKAEDSASANGDIGAYILGVRQDTLASSTSTDGDYGSIKTNDRGAMWSVPVGTVADDAVDSENPIKMGAKATNAALTGVSAAGDRADLITDLYRRIFINDSPNIAVNSQAVTVGTSAIPLPATALAGRRRIMIQNTSSNDIYVGPSGVTTSTGMRVVKGATLSLEIGEHVVLYGIAGSAGNSIVAFELA